MAFLKSLADMSAIQMGQLSTGLQAGGQALQGLSGLQQGFYQARVADNNAAMLKGEAQAARDSGANTEAAMKLQTGQIVSGQKAAQAANGIEVGSKTAEAVRDSAQREGDYNAMMEHYNASRAAFAYLVQAKNQKAQATLDRMGGIGAAVGGALNAGASYIAGAASTKVRRDTYKRVGIGA